MPVALEWNDIFFSIAHTGSYLEQGHAVCPKSPVPELSKTEEVKVI